MSKVAVVYWSGSGNTEAMANAVAEGARGAGAEVSVFEISDFTPDKVDEFDGIAFGCPAMGDEVLEEDVFQPAYDACKGKLSGKKAALFGSYGWGDGDWMRNWDEDIRGTGAVIAHDFVICNDAPDDEAAGACRELGAALA